MKINTFAVTEYKNNPVYVRNFGSTWEYLTVIKGEIYTFHMTIRPDFKNRVLSFLGLTKFPYSEKQKQGNVNYMRKLAEATVDTVSVQR